MNHSLVIQRIAGNLALFQALLSNLSSEEVCWKPAAEKWSILEVLNHLYDEEREDFRPRLRSTLEAPEKPWPPIAPQEWVREREYARRDYDASLEKFIHERRASITWLQQLHQPDWQATHLHPRLGQMTAEKILANWLAHDYHHIRQINALKYGFLRESVHPVALNYAGDW